MESGTMYGPNSIQLGNILWTWTITERSVLLLMCCDAGT